jgi:DNA (cytosine-5)-methyltransferase 1
MAQRWKKTKLGSSFAAVTVNKMGFTKVRIHPNLPTPTITGCPDLFHPYIMRTLSDKELQQASTFPLDYNFCDNSPSYIMGMSVPPVMIAQIA